MIIKVGTDLNTTKYPSAKFWHTTGPGGCRHDPSRRSARLSESVDPPDWRAMRDASLRRIEELGRYEWRLSSGCTRQSLAENAVSRFKAWFGSELSARRFDNQRAEAIIKCTVLNRMTSRGMPESVRSQ